MTLNKIRRNPRKAQRLLKQKQRALAEVVALTKRQPGYGFSAGLIAKKGSILK